MQTFVYRGDKGSFRMALMNAGFERHAEQGMIFNDVAKVRGYRRLKLWIAGKIQEAPQAQQEKLVAELKKEFGDRFISVYLTQTPRFMGPSWSLCVRVKP